KQYYKPMECIRLSRKFTQDENDAVEDTVCAIKLAGQLCWYVDYVPALYWVHYEFPAFPPADIFQKLTRISRASITYEPTEGYTLVFKQRTYSGYNLHNVLYRAAIELLPDVSKPDLSR